MVTVLRVFLVDDEPLALRRLSLALSAIHEVDVVGTARDGDSAVDEIHRLNPDLVIMDVEMPGRNGLSVAAQIQGGNSEIIILSAYDRYATMAFEVEALDYLLKPLRQDRLQQAIDRARRRRDEKAAHQAVIADASKEEECFAIHVPDRQGGHDVPLSDLIWIEAARDYALLHTATRTHIVRTTMNDLAKQLPEAILRVHRSTFVALAHVRRWGVPAKGIHSLVLSDGAEVTIGPSFIQDVRVALRSLER